MVAQFLGLKLRLLANIFRRSPWQVVGIVVGIVYGIGLAAFLFAALVGLRFATDVEVLRDVIIVIGSVTVLGFTVLPLVFGVDDTMDPRRFALFGVRDRTLAVALAAAACLGIPAIVLAIVLAGTVITWSRGVGEILFAILGALLAFATCILFSRVSSAWAAVLLETRRAREAAGVLGVLLLVLIAPVLVGLASVDWSAGGRGILRSAAGVLGWTPLGLPFAVPGDAAAGDWGIAVVKLLLSAGVLAIAWLAWEAVLRRVLVTPGRATSVRSYRGLGWFDRMPHSPTGAVAARSLTYWVRDPRYWVSLLMVPVVPVLVAVPLAVAGVPAPIVWLIPVPLVALFLGWTLHNDTAHDSTAVWLHVASDLRGTADRAGRLIPVLVTGLVVIALGSSVTAFVLDDLAVLPSIAGVSAALLLAGLGIGSITSAALPYPTVKPGDSPFQQPQATGTVAALVQSVTMIGSLVVAAPAAWFAWLGFTTDPDWHLIALMTGLGVGLLVLAVGVWAGGRVVDRRGPEILAAALRA